MLIVDAATCKTIFDAHCKIDWGTHHVLDAMQLQPRLQLLERKKNILNVYVRKELNSIKFFFAICKFYLEAEGRDGGDAR